jgi:DNA-binding protein YbaB
MFNKLKQLKDLRDKAKTIQNALAEEKVTGDRHGIKISLNGNMEVSAVVLEKEMTKAELEKNLPDAINDAIKKAQRVMAEKMRSMGGLPGMN